MTQLQIRKDMKKKGDHKVTKCQKSSRHDSTNKAVFSPFLPAICTGKKSGDNHFSRGPEKNQLLKNGA